MPSIPAKLYSQGSALEREVACLLAAAGIEFQREFQFYPARKWRADFFIAPDILLECEGGVWAQGRHTRPRGFLNDMEKYNKAAELGFRVLRCGGKGATSPSAVVAVIVKALKNVGYGEVIKTTGKI